jgi:hypothetical protein
MIFFDINKFPTDKGKGIIIFPISMSRISNSQNAKSCFKYVQEFTKSKILKSGIGLNIIYGDYLYFDSDEKANILKNKFCTLIVSHKLNFLKLITKDIVNKYIPEAFSFSTWNQMYLECKVFYDYFARCKKIYEKDKLFQKYILDDLKSIGKTKLTENQLNFFLEENLMNYLIVKGKVRLVNEYINDKQKWVLWTYPGKPYKAQIYLFQKNFFKLKNPDNIYENAYYDLESKKLYKFNNVDLDTIKL